MKDLDISVFYKLLKTADKQGNIFTVKNYLNVEDYWLFFKSDKIDVDEYINTLKKYDSLVVLYKTLNKLNKKYLKLYFSVKDYILEFGVFDENESDIYICGSCEFYTKSIKNIPNLNCISEVKNILVDIKLDGFKKLHIYKSHLKKIYNELGSTKIVDSNIIVKKIENTYFKKEDLEEYKMTKSFEYYLYQNKFFLKNNEEFYNYVILDDKYVNFYIKIK